MNISKFFVVAAVLAALSLPAVTLPEHVKFSEDGSFRVADAEFNIQYFNAGWNPSLNTNWKDRQGTLERFTAIMETGGQKGEVVYGIKPVAENEFEIDLQVKFPQPVQINALHGDISIPTAGQTIMVDGKSIQLPEKEREMIVYRNYEAKEFTLSVMGGTELIFSGDPLRLTVQDNRKFGSSTFSIRFAADPGGGEITESKLKLKVKAIPVKAQLVDISAAVNRDFRDDVAHDGKGGWTDQGSGNDLRMLTPGTVEVDSLKFNVIDAAKNDGKGVIVVAGSLRKFAPQSLELALPANDMKAINLLHASAWPPELGKGLGRMAVQYADGSEEIVPVTARIDCGNWWSPVCGDNAVIAWSGENPEARVGLYASSFPLKKAGPKSIRFEIANPAAVWMIAGVTLADRAIKFYAVSDAPVVLTENFEWKKLDFNREIIVGSPLDFSFLNDAPAGKYGRIVAAPDGTLVFENAKDKRIRLYGTNLCFSGNILSKETVDKMADYMVKCGYNTIRFHHHDTEMTDAKAADSLTLDPVKMDKFDYLFARMKEKGLYITTDLYTNRKFKSGDNIPECDFYDQEQMKMLIPVSRAAMENWKEFARRFMAHKNPYTGMTWGEDPALYCINLINEEALINNWDSNPTSIKLYEAAFAKYLVEKNLPKSECFNNNPVFAKFIQELQASVLDEQIRFVKEDLKLKMLVTSINNMNDIPLTLLRDKFDVVDNHYYFDHPGFVNELWRAPFSYRQDAAVARMALLPRDMMPSRIPGKPFLVTEFNYCNPNLYRAEGGPLIGAYSALQNWDALYRFAWSHGSYAIERHTSAYGFDAVNDPMAQLSDRIAIAMFVRGDVKAAETTYAYTVSPEVFDKKFTVTFPVPFSNLGLITAIGSIPADKQAAQNVFKVAPADASNPGALKDSRIAALWRDVNEKKIAASATGELLLDGNKRTFTVRTPLTETVTLGEGALSAGTLKVDNVDVWQTVAAISLDSKELSQSSSILIIHLTDIASTGLTFTNDTKTIVPFIGKLPPLIRKGSAEISLATNRPFKVTALKTDGSSYGEVKGEFKDNAFHFTANTALYPGGVMAYHLIR